MLLSVAFLVVFLSAIVPNVIMNDNLVQYSVKSNVILSVVMPLSVAFFANCCFAKCCTDDNPAQQHLVKITVMLCVIVLLSAALLIVLLSDIMLNVIISTIQHNNILLIVPLF
jgi:hypothetical protein